MSSRQAKVARVIPIDTPDNSSSDEGGDNSGDEEETGNEIQVFSSVATSLVFSLDHPKVEFEARGPEEAAASCSALLSWQRRLLLIVRQSSCMRSLTKSEVQVAKKGE